MVFADLEARLPSTGWPMPFQVLATWQKSDQPIISRTIWRISSRDMPTGCRFGSSLICGTAFPGWDFFFEF
jgi:hypothetical protein